MSKVAILGGLITLSAFAGVSQAEVLLSHTFDDVVDDGFPFGPAPVGSLERWEGIPQGTNGLVRVTSSVYAGASGKSVALRDSNSTEFNSVGVIGMLPTLNSGLVEVSWSFRAEFNNIFSLANIGGGKNWETSASQLMVINGDIVAGYGDGTDPDVDFINVGTFTPGQWVNVRYLFDLDNETFDLHINDVHQLAGYSFEDGYTGNFSNSGVAAFDIVSDLTTNDRAGAATLHLDNLLVQTVTAVPEPASLSLLAATALGLLGRKRRNA